MAIETEELECLQKGDSCQGKVAYRDVGRPDGKVFPRCEAHFNKRLASEQRNRELESPHPPSWFDPSYAGESWDEE
jgi:hypothetical protein